MNKIIISFVIIGIIIGVLGFRIGFLEGKKNSYEEIISEECWLNKNSRDIECIEYIKE